MSTTGAEGLDCRGIQLLLGVYVVGAIDPAERSIVDEHMGHCPACRDELAGLAGLPALLGRVPLAEAEQIAGAVTALPANEEPPPALLNAMLRKVWLTRRARTWRGVAAVAAAVLVAAGSAAAAVQLSAPSYDQATATNPSTGIRAVVDYTSVAWGSAIRVQVKNVPPNTDCQFYVLGKNGPVLAGTWTVGYDAGHFWYAAAAPLPAGSVHGFRLTAETKTGTKVLVSIPAR